MVTGNRHLERCRRADLLTCDPARLVDLQEVHIDTSRPVRERLAGFAEQMGNPYLFRVDELVIKVSFLPKGNLSLSALLPGLLIP